MKEYKHEWYLKNKERLLEKFKEYTKTPIGRAAYLVSSYNRYDKQHNREHGDLTAKWIVENIFSKPCAHCGKSGWQIIGCNRIDNSKPHTMDNVEPCCYECNCKEWGKDEECKSNMKKVAEKNSKQVYQYTIDNILVKIWKSAQQASKETGFIQSNISACCLGKRKTHKGYKWSFEPL